MVRGQLGQETDEGQPNEHAEDIEHDMRGRGLAGGYRFSHRCKNRGDAGPDIGAERQGDTGRQGHQPLARHHDGNAGGGGGRLNQAGEHRADQDAQQRIFKLAHQFQERRIAAQVDTSHRS